MGWTAAMFYCHCNLGAGVVPPPRYRCPESVRYIGYVSVSPLFSTLHGTEMYLQCPTKAKVESTKPFRTIAIVDYLTL